MQVLVDGPPVGEASAWREMLELNVLALAICTREAISDMKRRGHEGQIIHLIHVWPSSTNRLWRHVLSDKVCGPRMTERFAENKSGAERDSLHRSLGIC